MMLIVQLIFATTLLRKNNTTQYVARWLQATSKEVSWQFLTCHSCRRNDQFCTPSPCFLLSSLARAEAPFFFFFFRCLPPQRHRSRGGVESILDSTSAEFLNGVKCMQIPASSSEKARVAHSTEYYSVYILRMCINSLHVCFLTTVTRYMATLL